MTTKILCHDENNKFSIQSHSKNGTPIKTYEDILNIDDLYKLSLEEANEYMESCSGFNPDILSMAICEYEDLIENIKEHIKTGDGVKEIYRCEPDGIPGPDPEIDPFPDSDYEINLLPDETIQARIPTAYVDTINELIKHKEFVNFLVAYHNEMIITLNNFDLNRDIELDRSLLYILKMNLNLRILEEVQENREETNPEEDKKLLRKLEDYQKDPQSMFLSHHEFLHDMLSTTSPIYRRVSKVVDEYRDGEKKRYVRSLKEQFPYLGVGYKIDHVTDNKMFY